MMVDYLETFRVAERTLGIELRDKKYVLWVGGCSIGDTDTLVRARELLKIHMAAHLRVSIAGAEESLNAWRKELNELMVHPAGLLHFLVAYTKPKGVAR